MQAARPQSFWKRLAVEADHDGVAVVAKRRRVNARTLSWWRWKLSHAKTSAPQLLPVHVVEPIAERCRPEAIEIAVDGLRVHVAVGTDAEYVAGLVSTLRARCSR